MTTNQDNFDELIRQKFAEKEFVFNEENWEKMDAQIQTNKRVRKTALWSSIFVIGLISGVSLMFLFTNIFNSNKNAIAKNNTITTNEQNTSESTSQTSNATEIVVDNSTTNSVIKNEAVVENNSQNTTENTNTSATSIVEKNVSSKNTASSITAEEKNTPTNTADNNSKKFTSKTTGSNSASISGKKAKTVAASSSSTILAADLNKPENTTSGVSNTGNEGATTPNQNTNALAAKNTVTKETISPETTTESTNNNSTTVVKETAANTAAIQTSNEITLTTAATATKENGSAANENEAAVELKNRETSEDVNLDSLVTASDLAKDEKPQTSDNFRNNQATAPNAAVTPGLAATTFITAELGTNYTFGWNNTGVNEARGFNGIAGIGLTHYFNQKYGVNVGVQYGSIAYLNATQKTFTHKEYGFGSTSVDTTINTKYLHYVVIPLMAEYNINAKNSILLGGSASYLVNSNSSITVNSSSVGPAPVGFDTASINSATNTSVKGYYNGAFNKFDATVAIGYRRRLTDRISVLALANFGVMDVKKNDFFGINKTERNSGVKLIFTYKLFDLK